MVLAKQRERRRLAAHILNVHGAEFIGFYGRWAWMGYSPAVSAAEPTNEDGRSARFLLRGLRV
jgi:hypothetical protein